MYDEIFAGIGNDPTELVTVVEGADFDEMIMVRDIPLYFDVRAPPAAVQREGARRLHPEQDGSRSPGCRRSRAWWTSWRSGRRCRSGSRREIADTIDEALDPRGVFVVIEAEHLCMTMRGIKKPGSVTVTSAVRGLFRTDARTRQEAMNHIGMR